MLHTKAFHNRPNDGHNLGIVIAESQALTGVEIKRAYVDKGYIGHNASKPLRVYRSGQRRRAYGQIKKELRRWVAIEPVIGHLKSDGHLGRNYLTSTRRFILTTGTQAPSIPGQFQPQLGAAPR